MSFMPGREKRERSRGERAVNLATAHIAEALPWLLQKQDAPKNAETQIRDTFGALKADASDVIAAKTATDVLHAVVDAWNANHPQSPLPAPPSITCVRARNPGWSLARIARLKRWRPWGKALDTCLSVSQERACSAPAAAGLVLASAIRHGGLGDPTFLAVLTHWLAKPDTPLKTAAGLPLWLDLKARRQVTSAPTQIPENDVPDGLVSRVGTQSGEDVLGPYALRRWFIDPDTLKAIAAFFATPCGEADRAVIIAATDSRAGLTKLIQGGLDPDGLLGRPPGLASLIDGAFADLEAGATRLDSATSSIARGRLRGASPSPENWEATFRPASGLSSTVVPSLETHSTPLDVEPDEIEDDGFARREARAFSALHTLMASATPNKRRSLITEETRLTSHDFAQILESERKGIDWWPVAARLALDWYCHLAATLAPSTIHHPPSTIHHPPCAVIMPRFLTGCSTVPGISI